MPDFDDLQFNKPEDEVDFSNMSLDDLLESTKEELEEGEAAQAPRAALRIASRSSRLRSTPSRALSPRFRRNTQI